MVEDKHEGCKETRVHKANTVFEASKFKTPRRISANCELILKNIFIGSWKNFKQQAKENVLAPQCLMVCAVGVNDVTVSRERSNRFNLVTGDLLNFYISHEHPTSNGRNSWPPCSFVWTEPPGYSALGRTSLKRRELVFFQFVSLQPVWAFISTSSYDCHHITAFHEWIKKWAQHWLCTVYSSFALQ